jgi:selenocysteine-specific elongation factor
MERTQAKRGDVLGLPGEWRTTRTIEATLHPVRGLDRGITEKGAFKMYAGSAEVPAKIRLYDDGFLRLRLDAPVAAEVFDRYVLRDDGRGQTVGGGVVLDIDPPRRPGPDPVARLTRRATASRHELIDLLIEERGTVRTRDILALTGVPFDPKNSGEREWLYSEDIRLSAERAVIANLTSFHAEHPLAPGRDVAAVRNTILEVLRLGDDSLADALLQDLESTGAVRRQDSTVRLPGHETRPSGDGRFDRLVEVVGTEPPTLRELQSEGFSRDEIEAAVSAGVLVRVSPDFVMTTEFVERAQMLLESDAQEGITVSTFRERMNTSRKYAIPLLEYFDAKGVTRRVGDLRIARSAKS